MSKFEILTKYLPQLMTDDFGNWIIDRENDGIPERPIHMPYVDYSNMVNAFIDDVYQFVDNNKDYELTRYYDILKENGLEWSEESMREVDVSLLGGQCVMALIVGAVRAERFCDGALLTFFTDGSIRRWLERLKEINEMHIV